jgi:hypothetical protein
LDTEVAVALVVAIAGLCTTIIGVPLAFYTASRQFRIQMQQNNAAMIEKQAEANMDNADADSTHINNMTASIGIHNAAVEKVLARDMEIVDLNRAVADKTYALENAERKIGRLDEELKAANNTITLLNEAIAMKTALLSIQEKELEQERIKVTNAYKKVDATVPIDDNVLNQLDTEEP